MRQRQTGEGRHSLQTNLFSATTVLETLCTTNCTSPRSTTGTICHEQRTRARSFYWAHCSSAAVEACPRDIWDKLASSSAAPHQPSLLQTDVAQSSRLLYFFTIFCTQDYLHLRNRKYEPCTWAVEVWLSTFVQVVNTFGCQTLLGDIASKLIWIQDGADSLSSLLSISITNTNVKQKMPIFWKRKKRWREWPQCLEKCHAQLPLSTCQAKFQPIETRVLEIGIYRCFKMSFAEMLNTSTRIGQNQSDCCF